MRTETWVFILFFGCFGIAFSLITYFAAIRFWHQHLLFEFGLMCIGIIFFILFSLIMILEVYSSDKLEMKPRPSFIESLNEFKDLMKK